MASRECGVCLEQYDEGQHRPRCLSCGHTVCTSCLSNAITRNPASLTCPFCRVPQPHRVASVEDIPVNFTVLNLLQDTMHTGGTHRAQALLAEVKREANEFTTTHLVAYNCHLLRLKDYQERLASKRRTQEEQVAVLETLLTQHKAILKNLATTASHVTTVMTQGYDQREALKASQARINSATSLLQVTAAHEEDQTFSNNVEEWSKQAQQILQAQVVGEARELDRVTDAALQAVVDHNMAQVTEALAQTKPIIHHSPPGHPQVDFDYSSGVTLLVSKICQMADMVGSTVWVVKEDDGRKRCARLTLTPNRLYLSALREGDPPRYSHVLPFDEVRGLVEESCHKVYLEMSWEGKSQGRVCIKLVNTVTRTRLFFLLCTGELGPSYLNTRLLEVESRGMPGERIWGGDYQNNDGSGGAALPGLTRGPLHSQSATAGLVAGFCYGDDHRKPAHFVIYTGDCPVVYEECPLGRVEEGLDIVQAAAALPDITAATITECGVVISL
ncbi:hypothetical protein Pmani_002833 [Petrolisthes manimaculis]|uniref:RING-type domain-containing protein n=1 Tax=Petrolisthes manimaculis TaxID=1843537 RepID=A0AAE1UQM1_9EUCA|nr:hypothetical protein Pmani_002833 [Petrolisthes manimaculis]